MKISVSILSSDFTRFGEQIAECEAGGADWIHLDVMDGHFVPNITLGPVIVEAARRATHLPLDVHLMIENPDQYIPAFVDAGADWISVHQEACVHLHRTLELIHHHNAHVGVVLNPATPVLMLENVLDMVDHVLVMSVNPGFGGQKFIPVALEKTRRLVTMRAERRLDFRIEMDGGIAQDTVTQAVRAGVEILVAGNAVFGHGNPKENAQALLKLAQEATLQRV